MHFRRLAPYTIDDEMDVSVVRHLGFDMPACTLEQLGPDPFDDFAAVQHRRKGRFGATGQRPFTRVLECGAIARVVIALGRGTLGAKFESVLLVDGSETRWLDPGLFGEVVG